LCGSSTCLYPGTRVYHHTADSRPMSQEPRISMNDEALRDRAAPCMQCRIPYCHGSGCPVPGLIPRFNDLVCRGRLRDALVLLCTADPFPEITGRICPAPCERACVRGMDNAAVPFREIEVALAEKGFSEGWIMPEPPAVRTGKSVAVVGAGPAGLACALHLNRTGHSVRVFEKNAVPGGILYYGVPDFKLDKGLVRRRTDLLKQSGVVFETATEIGHDVPGLLKRFDAVVLAAGARQPRDISAPGRDLHGICFAMDYLTRQAGPGSSGPGTGEELLSAAGKAVVVIGGGDTGTDCAETALRQGARQLYQLEVLPQAQGSGPAAPMPDACIRRFNTSVERFAGNGGRLTGVETAQIKWDQGPSGRITCTRTAGTERVIPATTGCWAPPAPG